MNVLARLLLTVIVVGIVAAPATAKELAMAKVCGESGCTTVKDKGDLMAFADSHSSSAEPPDAAPFVTVELVVDIGQGRTDSWTVDYVPSAGVIRSPGEFGDDTWWTVSPSANTAMVERLTDITPYPKEAFAELLEMPAGTFSAETLEELMSTGSLPTQLTPEKLAGAQNATATPAPRDDASLAPWVIFGLAVALAIGGGAAVLRRRTTRVAA